MEPETVSARKTPAYVLRSVAYILRVQVENNDTEVRPVTATRHLNEDTRATDCYYSAIAAVLRAPLARFIR